jgi:signal transduction histidine kinase
MTPQRAPSHSAELPPGGYLLKVFEAIVQTVREPILVLDRTLTVRLANHAFHTEFRADPAETDYLPIHEIAGGHWGFPELRLFLEDVLLGHPYVKDLEIDHVFPHLGRRVLMLNARMLREMEDSEPLLLLAINDETDRKRIDLQLRNTAKKLERSNADLQEFARVVSHDLQEPLRKIQAFGDRLQTRAGTSLDEECTGYLGRVLSASARMRRLINDLLAYCRVQSAPMTNTRVDLAAVLREVLLDLEEQIAESGARVELDGTPEKIEAQAVDMRMLLQNLLSNSLKYRKAGVPPAIRISAKTEGGFLRLTVQDNGIGFDNKYRDKIFAVFQRLHGRDEYPGSGIGLALCQKIVHRHGGDISAHGSPGEGAMFEVNLPIEQVTEEKWES